MYCTKCGTPIDEDDNFCPKCGTKIVKKEIVVEKSEIEKISVEEEKPEKVKILLEKKPEKEIITEKISNEKSIPTSTSAPISAPEKISYLMIKNAGVSAVLSTFIPGLGQIYNGQIIKGIPIIIATGALLILSIAMRMPERLGVYLVFFMLWAFNIFDAQKSAEKINSKFRQ